VFESEFVWICTPFRLAFAASLFTVPHILSAGPFPWFVAKKCHSAERLKILFMVDVDNFVFLFLYWAALPSLKYITFVRSGNVVRRYCTNVFEMHTVLWWMQWLIAQKDKVDLWYKSERMKNCFIFCPMRTSLWHLGVQMNNSLWSLPKLCVSLSVEFILAVSNIWPVDWQ
jgi:hypothetical protein